MGTSAATCAYCQTDDAYDDPRSMCENCGWICHEKGAHWCAMCGDRLSKQALIMKLRNDRNTQQIPPDNMLSTSRVADDSLGGEGYTSNEDLPPPGEMASPTLSGQHPLSEATIEYPKKGTELCLTENSANYHAVESIRARADEIQKFIKESIETGDLLIEKNDKLTVYRWDGGGPTSPSIEPYLVSDTLGSPGSKPGGKWADHGGEDLRTASLERRVAEKPLKGGEDVRAASLEAEYDSEKELFDDDAKVASK